LNFIDEATITAFSGKGGAGCVSFRREKFIPKGGPDGGDGGKGGDIVLRVAPGKLTLYDFRFKKMFKAPNGGHGQGRKKTGKDGTNLIIDLPPGTLVKDAETDRCLADMVAAGQTFVVAKGGRGGRGNTRFKSSTHRTPRFAQPGEPGQNLSLKLELRILADIGIIGLPNAGKSTLIRAITSANPKIGAYPFTTLSPNLGVIQSRTGKPIVLADIPGLIEGAHKGAGLGIQFLRHIKRTRILLHLIDVSGINPHSPLEAYETVNKELKLYEETLLQKPQVVVLNKIDLLESNESTEQFEAALTDKDVIHTSALTGAGIKRLISHLEDMLGRNDE
jgi:GTP-binding protein